MNVFIAKMLMYHQVQQLTAEGYSVTRISTVTGLHWRTVKKYIGMTALEFEVFQESQSGRKKQLQPYEQFVKGKLELYRELQQLRCMIGLKSIIATFPTSVLRQYSTFVQWVRRRHNLPLVEHLRDYETVPEAAYGKQAQVDFGESTLRTSRGGRIKVFFFCMSLSRSRYKYLWFITRPFTSELAVYGHEKAFAFFDDIAEVIVFLFDQKF